MLTEYLKIHGVFQKIIVEKSGFCLENDLEYYCIFELRTKR